MGSNFKIGGVFLAGAASYGWVSEYGRASAG
jgi:hypothetical protein